MKLTNRRVATAFGAALLLGASTAVIGSAGAQEGQGAVIPPTVNEVPSSEHQQNVLTPVPDVHGRAGQGTAQQSGSDQASPGGSTGTMGGQTGSGMAAGAATGQPGGTTGDIPATQHQQELLRPLPDDGQKGGTSQ